MEGDQALCPTNRTYTLKFHSIQEPERIELRVNGDVRPVQAKYDAQRSTLVVALGEDVQASDAVTILLAVDHESLMKREEDILAECLRITRHFRMETWTKDSLYNQMEAIAADPSLLTLARPEIKPAQLRALLEVITRAGMHRFTQTGEDEIILWNETGTEDAQYSLTVHQHARPRPFPGRYHHVSGALPHFAFYTPSEQFHRNPWELRLNYFGQFEFECE